VTLGGIAGLVAGGVFLITVVVFTILFMLRRAEAKKQADYELLNPSDQAEHEASEPGDVHELDTVEQSEAAELESGHV
jgi:hypothetical protein